MGRGSRPFRISTRCLFALIFYCGNHLLVPSSSGNTPERQPVIHVCFFLLWQAHSCNHNLEQSHYAIHFAATSRHLVIIHRMNAIYHGMYVEEINLHGCPGFKSQTQHRPKGASVAWRYTYI